MAKLNTHAQLSPTEPNVDEESINEDELEAGSDDEKTAKTLSMSLGLGKNLASQNTKSTGVMKTIGRLLGIGGEPTAEELFYPNKDLKNGKNSPTVATTDGEGPGHVGIDYLTPASRRKRDIYDFEQANPEDMEEEVRDIEDPVRKRAKPKKTSKKTKPPPVSPNAHIITQRQTKANKTAASREVQPEMNYTKSTPNGANGVVKTSESPKKRGRGRPPKKRSLITEASSELPDLHDVGQPGKPSVEHSNSESEGTEDDVPDSKLVQNEVSGILMDPSPAKPIRADPPETHRLRRAKQLQNLQSASVKAVTPPPKLKSTHRLQKDPEFSPLNVELGDLSGSEGELEDEEQVDGATPDILEGLVNSGDDVAKTLKDVIGIEKLEGLLETARSVGHKQTKATKQLEQKRTEQSPYTAPGKRLKRRLERLIQTYSKLKTATLAGNDTAALQLQISAVVEKLKRESEVVFERLENPTHEISDADIPLTVSMLTDIYFILVPKLVETLKLAVEAHEDEQFSKTIAVEEICDLLGLLQRLAEAAIQQRQANQPKARKNNGYRILSPTKSILPVIRVVHKSLRAEILRREHAEKIAAWNSGAADREQRRAALEARDHQEKQRQRSEIYRMQQEVIDAKLSHPLYGPYLQAEIDRDSIKAQEKRMRMLAATSRQGENFTNSQRSGIQESYDDEGERIEADPFNGRYERIKVFPNNNATNYRGTIPLSKEEKVAFIESMRREKKEVRYEVAARLLNRSLDDIFAFAKDLQEAMDHAHEQGRLNQECDEWTYDIWLEQ